ncbi:MAG: hypothetical protein ACRCZ2_12965, partial [Fusobacteriaceae bacterium]
EVNVILMSNTGIPIVDEILNSPTSSAYIELSKEIARQEERLGATTGFFWKVPLYSDAERAGAEATLNLLKLARSQFASKIAGIEPNQNITIGIAHRRIDL